MSDNIIQIKNWMRSPSALRGIDRQIQDLADKLEELMESKEQSIKDLEEVLQWAIDAKIPMHDPRVQSSLEQFVDDVCLEDEPIKVASFNTLSTLLEDLDEVIVENIVSLTKKRLEALRLKWQVINQLK